MKNLVTVTREARKYGARIVVEWPRNCSYWQDPIVQRYMHDNQLRPVQVDGCSVGLRSVVNGLPIYKPWTIATNDIVILRALEGNRCPGVGANHKHQRCQSGDTKRTESYTNDLVQKIHDAFKRSVDEGPLNARLRGEGRTCPRPQGDEGSLYPRGSKAPFIPCLAAIEEDRPGHRPRVPREPPWFSACVAKQIPPREVKNNPQARKAIKDEGAKLEKAKTWDLGSVRERASVQKESRTTGVPVIFGRVFPICVIKNSEMEEEHHVYKGRIVFQGNNAKDQDGRAAKFQEMSSAPASMEAGKVGDAYGLVEGNDTQQADAEQAYIQCDLGGDKTWVELPKDLQPEEWSKYRDPVCLLKKSLYGHPDSGGYWEQHCESRLLEAGFVPINSWRSCFWHTRLKLYLTVYVDDFKLSGPKESLDEGWSLIRGQHPKTFGRGIKTDNPKPSNRYLGCYHNVDGHSIEYEMKDFMRECCNKYCGLAGASHTCLVPSKTPFLDEACLEEDDHVEQGDLGDEASSILMKILYGARMARYDLLRATCALASKITKWTRACDKKLYKLVCYINSTLDYVLKGSVHDPLDKLSLKLFADADFAGCEKTARSTSGVFLCLVGPNTFMPLAAISKKQSCVSHSTPEAELVAVDLALRAEGLPALDVWEVILGRPVKLAFQEDNQAAIVVLQSGYSTALRHMGRTHKVCLKWLHERIVNEDIELEYCVSSEQAADVFTKAFTEPTKWEEALANINVGAPTLKSSSARLGENDGKNPTDSLHKGEGDKIQQRAPTTPGGVPEAEGVKNHVEAKVLGQQQQQQQQQQEQQTMRQRFNDGASRCLPSSPQPSDGSTCTRRLQRSPGCGPKRDCVGAPGACKQSGRFLRTGMKRLAAPM
jgi:hypothetical protein